MAGRFLAILGLLAAGPALADGGLSAPVPVEPGAAKVVDLACELTDGSDSCTRFLACIGKDGLWLNGRSHGRGHGTVDGVLSDGRACRGIWAQDEAGAWAKVICDGMPLFDARATYQDHYTGTTTGVGQSVDGAIGVEFWSGLNLRDLLDEATGARKGPLPCIPAEALIS